jgi:hypothetical protein
MARQVWVVEHGLARGDRVRIVHRPPAPEKPVNITELGRTLLEEIAAAVVRFDVR